MKMRWMVISGIGVLLTACGGQDTITSAWKKVDSCLEQHPSFVGNVVIGKGGPSDAIDTLSVEGSGGALANAYRFPSSADARSAEHGIGPPGPTVSFYGNIAFEMNASTSLASAGAIEACFKSVYGTAATAPPTHPTTGPLPSTGTRSCDGTVFAGATTSCSLAQDVFTAFLDALNRIAARTGTSVIPPRITAIGGTTPLIRLLPRVNPSARSDVA